MKSIHGQNEGCFLQGCNSCGAGCFIIIAVIILAVVINNLIVGP